MRTTVNIQDPILANARRIAAQRGVTLSEVVEDALRMFLSDKPRTRRTPFRLHTVKGRMVNPDLNLDRTSELLLLDDEASFGRQAR